jgi:LuxR family maltose regulon positive regulatory protein
LNAYGEGFSAPLIKTKLIAPQLRANLVARSQLLHQLEEDVLPTFILVCAPAGYGKTTLLINWIANLKKSLKPDNPIVCWLSLEDGDNEAIRFLSYLVAAIDNANTGISTEAHTMLQSSTPPPLRTIMGVLINDLEKLAISICLVLDDYQFISNSAIHEGMAFLLDHLPANVHLVIATRSDPPIPLARLRARGQMIEIRANELRFSAYETECLLNQIMGLGLSSSNLAQLEEMTEGWIAGLQMAAIALKSISQTEPADTSLFIRNFAGSNRYILDYLVEEVLSHQPQDIQDFLLQTSILENLCGSLCDSVTRIHSRKSKSKIRSSQQTLEYLERSNLFLVSLDSDRLWYRYHHLFADLLRARLEQQVSGKVPELHVRASEWFEEHQRLPEAVNHALEAMDYERSCRLIEVLVDERMPAQNGLSMLWGWIRRLPPEIVMTRPWLCIIQAMSAMFINDVNKIEPFLQAAEQAIHPGFRPDLVINWKGHIASMRAFVADIHNDVPKTIEMAQQALECLRPDYAATRTFAKYMLGRAYFICGDFSQAIETLKENIHECIEAKGTNIIAPSLSMLSKVYRIKGNLRESVEVLDEGRAYIEKCDPRRVTVAGLALLGPAFVLHEWNDLDEAEKIIRRSLELCEPWANPSATCRCYVTLARVLQNQGNLPAAVNALRMAEESIRGHSPLPELICDLNAIRVGIWLATFQLSRASQWAHDYCCRTNSSDTFSIPKEQDEITLARVFIAEGNLEIALQTLENLAMATETGGRIGHLIEILKLQALALQANGDQEQALEIFQKCLAAAEQEGYVRTFIDEGEPIREMLLAYVHAFPAGHITYAQKLLAAFTAPGSSITPDARSSNLIGSLTAREFEVLQAIAEGFSNHMIAEKFTLADGTVKFYVHAVLEKLGVHNRTQAVIEAKKLKII